MKISAQFSCWLLTLLLSAASSLQAGQPYQPISLPELLVEREKDFRLHLEAIASLPGGLVFLGGADRSQSGVLGPVLLISRDSGNTWRTHHLDLEGVGARMIKSAGVDSLWVLLTDRAEGADYPTHLLRSDDGGKRWHIISLTLSALEEPLASVASLEVFDRRFGLLSLKGSLGGRVIYETRNGGIDWRVLWQSQREPSPSVELDYAYPEREPLPLHAPLWVKTRDHYRINGLLRVVRRGDIYVVERFGFDKGREWAEISQIQRRQRK